MRTADNKLTPLAKAFTVAMSLLIAAVGVLIYLVVLIIQDETQDQLILDQSEKNQLHIDCIIALNQPVLPGACEPVRAQLLAGGFITQAQLDENAAERNSTTTIPATTP